MSGTERQAEFFLPQTMEPCKTDGGKHDFVCSGGEGIVLYVFLIFSLEVKKSYSHFSSSSFVFRKVKTPLHEEIAIKKCGHSEKVKTDDGEWV